GTEPLWSPCTVSKPTKPGLWTARGTSCELRVDYSPLGPQDAPPAGDRVLVLGTKAQSPCTRAQLSCLMASASMLILATLPTSTPPVSRAWFQVRPNCSRSTSVWASKPIRALPHGSMEPPSKETESGTERVTPRTVSSPSTFQRPLPSGVTLV